MDGLTGVLEQGRCKEGSSRNLGCATKRLKYQPVQVRSSQFAIRLEDEKTTALATTSVEAL